MSYSIKISVYLFLASIIAFTGYKKDNDDSSRHNQKDYKISVSGNTYEDFDFVYDYIIDDIWYAGPYANTLSIQCTEAIYFTTLQFELSPRVSLWIVFKEQTDNNTLPTGTFSCDIISCNLGCHGTLLGSSENLDTSYELGLSSGTVTVSKISGTGFDESYPEYFHVEIDVTIAPEFGGGTIKGIYSGKIHRVDFK